MKWITTALLHLAIQFEAPLRPSHLPHFLPYRILDLRLLLQRLVTGRQHKDTTHASPACPSCIGRSSSSSHLLLAREACGCFSQAKLNCHSETIAPTSTAASLLGVVVSQWLPLWILFPEQPLRTRCAPTHRVVFFPQALPRTARVDMQTSA